MARPFLLTVDDDPDVVQGVERDLRRKYGAEYRILRASSGTAALDLLKQVKKRNEPVALLLVDQRMPQMSGVEFLAHAREFFPAAKRVLLTAYADTNAAIEAINNIRIDYYLLKPWDPPEQHLYPVLDDLLGDWKAGFRPPFEGVRVLGHRWSAATHELKEFLGRNQVPYRWMDVEGRETDRETRELLDALGPDELKLPMVFLPNGTSLSEPTPTQVAAKIGMNTRAKRDFYDLAIIGAGPAGLAAAVYGASEGLKTVMIEREAPGGQAGMSSRIENYLGFPSGLSGADLTRRAVDQARKFEAEILTPQEARCLRAEGPYRNITLMDNSEISCHALLIATGVSWRKLDVPGLDRLQGAGVYYGAAMTEALSCRDEDVYVVGGANSAGQAAMHFSQFARSVTMLVRGDSLAKSMSYYLIQQIEKTPNIRVETETEIVEAKGDGNLKSLVTVNRATQETQERPATALFIFIGAKPRTEWLQGVLPMDDHGFLLTGPDLMKDGKPPAGWNLDRDPYLLETAMPGVFAAGDTRHGSVKRVASGVGEGAICVQMIHQYLSKIK